MAQQLAEQQQALLMQMTAEGLLDEQFQQLLALQDETNPDFVTEVAELYFDDAVPKIQRVGQLLSEAAPDFGELDAVVHQFKGSSASLGAGGMAKLCIRMRELCQQRDVPGCQALVMQVRGGARGSACMRARTAANRQRCTAAGAALLAARLEQLAAAAGSRCCPLPAVQSGSWVASSVASGSTCFYSQQRPAARITSLPQLTPRPPPWPPACSPPRCRSTSCA